MRAASLSQPLPDATIMSINLPLSLSACPDHVCLYRLSCYVSSESFGLCACLSSCHLWLDGPLRQSSRWITLLDRNECSVLKKKSWHWWIHNLILGNIWAGFLPSWILPIIQLYFSAQAFHKLCQESSSIFPIIWFRISAQYVQYWGLQSSLNISII